MRLVSLALISALAAVAQATKPAGGDAQATFSTTTQLVVETVNVKDKSGKSIDNLTAKDFTITEDGVPQAIRFFELQQLPDVPNTSAIQPAPAQRPEPFKRLTRTQLAPEAPGNPRYRNHRLLALYFDMSAMPPADQLRALDGAEQFIRNQMTASDLMAVMTFTGGAVQVMTDFTDDRDRLMRILETLIVGEDQDFIQSDDDASSADTGTAFGQDDSEFNIFNTDRQLSALQTAATMLGELSEKKALLYFASGLRLNGVDNQAQLHATINAAIHAGVSFWPIDARGLVAQAPLRLISVRFAKPPVVVRARSRRAGEECAFADVRKKGRKAQQGPTAHCTQRRSGVCSLVRKAKTEIPDQNKRRLDMIEPDGAKLARALLLASTLVLAPVAAWAGPIYTYDFYESSYDVNNAPSVFGTALGLTISFTNGNTTNENQTYTWADIAGVTVTAIGGTFVITGTDPETISFTGNSADAFATTDAQGNINVNTPIILADTITLSVIGKDESIQLSGWFGDEPKWALANYGSVDTAQGRIVPVPEPSPIALLALGLLGFGLLKRRYSSSAMNV